MISRIETNLTKLNTSTSSPSISTPPAASDKLSKKTIGEIAPKIVDPSQFPELAALLTHYGVISRIRRKLMTLCGKKGQIVLAENTIGAADNKGVVYLGVDFLSAHQNNPALLAGVMAHEWGHLISNLNKHGNLDHLNWDQLHEIRRDEEASADAFCGRIMPMMGYSVEPLVEFLEKSKEGSETQKYYSIPIRVEIIREATKITLQRQSFSKRLFASSVYPNPYNSTLIIA